MIAYHPRNRSTDLAARSRFTGEILVAATLALILVTGFVMIIAMGGFGAVGGHIHLMTAFGLVMASIFGFIVAVPFQRFRAALAQGALEPAGQALAEIRRLVGINLVLGLVTITIAVLGHDVVTRS